MKSSSFSRNMQRMPSIFSIWQWLKKNLTFYESDILRCKQENFDKTLSIWVFGSLNLLLLIYTDADFCLFFLKFSFKVLFISVNHFIFFYEIYLRIIGDTVIFLNLLISSWSLSINAIKFRSKVWLIRIFLFMFSLCFSLFSRHFLEIYPILHVQKLNV